MCTSCGCGSANLRKLNKAGKEKVVPEGYHVHSDGTIHTHADDLVDHQHHYEGGGQHAHPHPDQSERRVLELERKVLEKNDRYAGENREFLAKRGILAVNIISSPGSGKTFLLEKTLERLKGKIPCAVIVGDIQSSNDARRLQGKGAKVHQIETKSSCHLHAEQVGNVFHEVIDKKTKILFIENVGNLVCPAAFDLGENFKIALLSTPEGEDKPVKYPVIFSDAKVIVLTKIDLLDHVDCDLKKVRKNIRQLNPGVFVFELSAKTGEGMDAWIDYLAKLTA
ncbi:MAG: hydrogenase accessory protein HypB [Lentisphaerae bacterium GWF2_50_93]|nr:MAG: hydrogenase accessory protein HypB [Lentisphaerae bacterium GWF2_50_93]